MKKILVADDSMFMRKILADLIGKEYQIVEAGSGAEVLETFKKEKPDLTLLDIVMPEGDEEGVRLLGKIRKADPAAKVVMISAVGQDAMAKECRDQGALDYIVKPFEEARVRETIRRYLG